MSTNQMPIIALNNEGHHISCKRFSTIKRWNPLQRTFDGHQLAFCLQPTFIAQRQGLNLSGEKHLKLLKALNQSVATQQQPK